MIVENSHLINNWFDLVAKTQRKGPPQVASLPLPPRSNSASQTLILIHRNIYGDSVLLKTGHGDQDSPDSQQGGYINMEVTSTRRLQQGGYN